MFSFFLQMWRRLILNNAPCITGQNVTTNVTRKRILYVVLTDALTWTSAIFKSNIASEFAIFKFQRTTLRFLLYVLVPLYVLFWFLKDRLFIFITALLFLIYQMYCSNKMWIVLLIFITVLLFLLYVLFYKNQACNIYKYWSYNRNLRVISILLWG